MAGKKPEPNGEVQAVLYTHVIPLEEEDTDGNRPSIVLFRLLGERLPEATVPLSRNGDGCATPLSNLWAHDHHAPMFKTDDDRETYVTRVVTAIDAAMAANANEPKAETGMKLVKSYT